MNNYNFYRKIYWKMNKNLKMIILYYLYYIYYIFILYLYYMILYYI